jgi:hypothetical protein
MENEKPTSIDGELIAKALEDVRAYIRAAEQQRAELERAVLAAKEEERLLVRLLSLRTGEPPQEVMHGATQTPSVERSRATASDAGASEDKPAVEAAVRELAAAGRPVHISDLMRLLRERKVHIPGAGTQANLIAHLRRDKRVVRPSRGMYALAAWGLEEMPDRPRRRKKRRLRAKDSE